MAKLVLAIDDDKYVHHIIEESLAGFCKIIHAKDGDEGLRLTNKYNPDQFSCRMETLRFPQKARDKQFLHESE